MSSVLYEWYNAAMKDAIKQLIRYQQIKALYQKYERFLLPATLIVGVIFDWLTFTSISLFYTFVLLLVYAAVSGLLIAYIQMYDSRNLLRQAPFGASSGQAWGKMRQYLRLGAPLLLQVAFGSLLSASFLFYWFSGAVAVSWPIILLLAILMVGNEVFREHYMRPTVQISIYFFILFSLATVILPFAFNTLSPWLYVLGGAVSVGLIVLFVRFLGRFVPDLKKKQSHVYAAVVVIVAVMNALYFTNVIPPVPLALREAGVYHEIVRQGGEYRLTGEKETWWERLVPGQTIHVEAGKPVYVFTMIFAPAELNTKIVHHWKRYDETKQQWVDADMLSFTLTGGRQGGFRGYSRKTTVPEGKWRVYVETERGQVIGRVGFRVERGEGGEMETWVK